MNLAKSALFFSILCLGLLFTRLGYSKEYTIYSISHKLPNQKSDRKIHKNYYINMGLYQGLKKGTILDVYRNLSVINPYKKNDRPNYKILIGQLEVVHVGEFASIGIQSKVKEKMIKDLNLDIPNPKIGDRLQVAID